MFYGCGDSWQRNRLGRPRRVWRILLGIAVWLVLAACMPSQTAPPAPILNTYSSPPPIPTSPVSEYSEVDGARQWAILRDQTLVIHYRGDASPVEDCRAQTCMLSAPTWTPGGRYLLYVVEIQASAEAHGSHAPRSGDVRSVEVRAAALDGTRHTLATYPTTRATPTPPTEPTVVVFIPTQPQIHDAELLTPAAVEALYQNWIANFDDEGSFADAPPPAELLNDFDVAPPPPPPGTPDMPHSVHP